MGLVVFHFLVLVFCVLAIVTCVLVLNFLVDSLVNLVDATKMFVIVTFTTKHAKQTCVLVLVINASPCRKPHFATAQLKLRQKLAFIYP